MVSEHNDYDPVITHIKDNILVSSFSVVIVKYIQEQQNHHEISYLSISQRSRKAGRHSSTYVFCIFFISTNVIKNKLKITHNEHLTHAYARVN